MIWIILVSLIVLLVVFFLGVTHGRKVEAKKIKHIVDVGNQRGNVVTAGQISKIIYDHVRIQYQDGVDEAAEIIAGLFQNKLKKNKKILSRGQDTSEH